MNCEGACAGYTRPHEERLLPSRILLKYALFRGEGYELGFLPLRALLAPGELGNRLSVILVR